MWNHSWLTLRHLFRSSAQRIENNSEINLDYKATFVRFKIKQKKSDFARSRTNPEHNHKQGRSAILDTKSIQKLHRPTKTSKIVKLSIDAI